jgi:hypothetical protein
LKSITIVYIDIECLKKKAEAPIDPRDAAMAPPPPALEWEGGRREREAWRQGRE